MGNKIPYGIINKTGNIPIEDRIVDLKYAKMFIGVSSGLSWLAWSVGTPVVLISGFTSPFFEFKSKIRIHNKNVCNSCLNDVNFEFDRVNWNWCPKNKDFECTRKITVNMVIERIEEHIEV